MKFCLFFDNPRESGSDVTSFLNMRFVSTQNKLFEKILHVVNKLPSQEGFIEDFVENGT